MKFKGNVVLTVLALFSFVADANDKNQFDYFGVSLQHNIYDDLDFAPQIDTDSLTPLIYHSSSSAKGFRGFYGRQFNRYLSVEAGVSSFGTADFSVIQKDIGADDKVTNAALHRGDFKTMGADIRAIGTYQLDESLFMKAHIGAVLWDNEISVLANENTALSVGRTSDSGVSLLIGIGLGYSFSQRVAVSLDFENTEISNINTKNLAFSIMYKL